MLDGAIAAQDLKAKEDSTGHKQPGERVQKEKEQREMGWLPWGATIASCE